MPNPEISNQDASFWGTVWDVLAPFMVLYAIMGAIGLLVFIWYLWSMGRLFPRLGLPAGQGWIPLWNEWRLIDRAGLPGWVALLYLIPGLGVVPLIVRTMAQHRIGGEAGLGGGFTVLGFFIPPLWATLLGTRLQGRVLGEQRSATWPGQAAPYAATPGFVNPSAPAPPPQQHLPVAPDPWASPAWASRSRSGASSAPPVSAPVSAAPPAAAPSPFDSETEAEYARLAAEPFQAPPAAPLGHAAAPEPFSWTAAARSEPAPPPSEPPSPPVHPAAAPVVPPPVSLPPVPAQPAPPSAPVAAAHRPSGITANYEPLAPAAPAPVAPAVSTGSTTGATDSAVDDLDQTVVVRRSPAITWSIVLPSGEELAIGPDTVVGRKPQIVGGAQTLEIPDPTRTLSKTHARLRFDGEHWTVEDLDSTNGVFVISDDGAEQELEPNRPAPAGRHLMLGTLEVRLRRSDETA